jgi:hypothetical protein
MRVVISDLSFTPLSEMMLMKFMNSPLLSFHQVVDQSPSTYERDMKEEAHKEQVISQENTNQAN